MDYNILKKSLKMVAAFTENSHAINTADEFLTIHTRNMDMLHQYVEKHNDDFVKELVSTIPNLKHNEIQGFIDNNRGVKHPSDYFGLLGYVYMKIFNVGGVNEKNSMEKFHLIASRNITIIKILENSGY
ncbi:MAG: hypothetical protein ACSHWW_04790 [Nonlabens sp.]|uniref:hypothetical protein n=1 Tax=Nonlabens sp. TaxID=1888209 RepID=UPI003EFACA94